MKRIILLSMCVSGLTFGFGVGPFFGYTSPKHLEGTFTAGIRGELMERFGLDANYWKTKSKDGLLEVSDVQFKPWARFVVDIPLIKPYAGAGVGFHFYDVDVKTISGPSNFDDPEMGLHAFAGANVVLAPLTYLFAEMDFEFISDYRAESYLIGCIFEF